jgi:hypothetical protein
MSEAEEPRRRQPLPFVVVGALVLLAASYGWKELSLFRLEQRLEREQAAERAELALRESQLRDAAVARVSELLELVSVPLGWAVRDAALEHDLAQIERYMQRLVEQRAVRGVAWVDGAGLVLLATERTLEGRAAASAFGDLTAAGEAVLRDVGGELRLMVPVLDGDERLGSLVVAFSRELLLPFAGTS